MWKFLNEMPRCGSRLRNKGNRPITPQSSKSVFKTSSSLIFSSAKRFRNSVNRSSFETSKGHRISWGSTEPFKTPDFLYNSDGKRVDLTGISPREIAGILWCVSESNWLRSTDVNSFSELRNSLCVWFSECTPCNHGNTCSHSGNGCL